MHRWFEAGEGDEFEQQNAIAEVVHVAFADMTGADPAREAAAVGRARDFIEERYDTDFGLEELAEAAGASKFHLARCFRKELGISPVAYRTQRRIREAKRLVLAGQPLSQIAADLGFADQSHLTRRFQAIVGTSPARYREQ